MTTAALDAVRKRAVPERREEGFEVTQEPAVGFSELLGADPKSMPRESRLAAAAGPHQILLRPLVTEKGIHRSTRHNAYAFEINAGDQGRRPPRRGAVI